MGEALLSNCITILEGCWRVCTLEPEEDEDWVVVAFFAQCKSSCKAEGVLPVRRLYQKRQYKIDCCAKRQVGKCGLARGLDAMELPIAKESIARHWTKNCEPGQVAEEIGI